MIKALFLIEDTSYQFDSRVRREIITLQAMGIEAIVICPANAFDESAVYEENGVKVYRYYVENRGKGIKAHLREYALSLFHQTFLTAKVFRKHGFSVIHLGNHSDLFWLVVLPYKLMGKIFIYDQHDPVPELFDIRFGHRVPGLDHLVRLFEKVSYMFADHVITINETCQKLALTRGGKSPNQVTVVRNGPNLRDFPEVIPDPRVRALGRTIVGYLGNMNLQDNLEVFIEMARILHLEKKRTDIGFVMVGSGTDWLRLKSLRDKLRLTDVIYMPGRLAWEDVLSTMAATDICVQPDLPNKYSNIVSMNKLLEYMALGKAAVAFDLKETRISGGEVVVYCPESTSSSLAEKIIDLADDEKRCLALGKEGRQLIEDKLGWHHQAQALCSIYERLFPGILVPTEAK